MNHAVNCPRLASVRQNFVRIWSVSLLFLLAVLAMPAFAVQPVQPDQSQTSFLTQPVVTPALHVLPDASATTSLMPGTKQQPGVDAFLSRAGGQWEMRWDARAGRPNLIQGSGVPLIPGSGNQLHAGDIGLASGQRVDMAKLEQLLRGFAERNAELLGITGMQFRLDAKSSVPYGDGTTHWFVQLDQYYDGVKVDNAYLYFRLSHGNIVQFGAYRVAPVNLDVTPTLGRDDAFNAAFAQMPFRAGARLEKVVEPGKLLIVPTSANQQPLGVNYAGAEGHGYGHRLVWRFVYRLQDDASTYEVLFDAHSNQLLQVRDLTVNVEATVTGGIYPVSNLDPEINAPLPFVDVSNSGTKTTDLDGHYDYTGGTASADLGGKYYDINDTCGGISLSNSSTGNLDFGGSGGTDCTTPGVGGAGNTHASRSAFYHLTLINRNADTYYPANGWLDGNVGVNVNLNQTCNAYWDGFELNFFHSNSQCSNTGELAGVFLHEWGHGFDTNTGGSAPEYGSGEAVGDTFAFIYTGDSCIGTGFWLNRTCLNCNNGCSGVRDVSVFSTRGTTGSIAMPSTVLDPNGISAPTECPYFTPSGVPYQGVMGYEGHRESLIASSANWDLAQNLVDEYGEDGGWAEMNRIWYGSLVPSKSAYQIVSGGQCNVNAEIDGCGATNWYTVFLAADDDDGNLANGTPNACRIWDAYEAHGIACGARPACTGGAEPGFTIVVTEPDQLMCAPGSADYSIDVGSVASFADPVTLAVSGLPSGLTASFALNPVTPGSSTVLTLTGDATLLAGDYDMTVDGTATGADPVSTAISLHASTGGAPATPVLSAPADGAVDVPASPTFSWQAVAGADSYTLEVATDAAFANTVITQSGIADTSFVVSGLDPLTTYYWRVSAENACGVSAASAAFSFTTSAQRYLVSGSVSGLTGNGLELQLNGAQDLPISADGAFQFPIGLLDGESYSVSVSRHPSGQICSVTNGSGVINGQDVSNVEVNCGIGGFSYTVGGTVSGLTGSGLVLQLNGSYNLNIVANGDFTFPTTLFNGASYAVTVLTQPGGETCSVANGSGVINGQNVSDVEVDCGSGTTYTVGGTVSGMTGSGLVLQLNGSSDLNIAADGGFTFPDGLADGSSYAVTVLTQPSAPDNVCTVANGSGTIAGADVTDVTVSCVETANDVIFADGFELPPPDLFTVGGNVSGLTGSGLQLQLNAAESLPISADGAFTFSTGLADGEAYAVTVLSQPTAQTCTVANGSGSIAGSNVTNVAVTCVDSPPFTQPIQDPGFEATTSSAGSNPFWDGADSEDPTGTPFYTNNPNNGTYSIWFGGWRVTGASSGSASQDVMIASGGPRYLHYWRNISLAPGGVTELVISIDGAAVSTVDLTAEGLDPAYTEFVVDISAYADDAIHTLELSFSHDGGGSGDDGNTFIDDVTIEETP